MKTLADLTAPAQIVRVLSEADLQDQCVKWARGRDYWARKFSSMSQRSVPDYLFSCVLVSMWDGGQESDTEIKFATEFKKPGTKPKLLEKYGVKVMSTEVQYEEQLKMREAGWFVFECDDFEMFKKTVLDYERKQQ